MAQTVDPSERFGFGIGVEKGSIFPGLFAKNRSVERQKQKFHYPTKQDPTKQALLCKGVVVYY
jgi:hypothetical protein